MTDLNYIMTSSNPGFQSTDVVFTEEPGPRVTSDLVMAGIQLIHVGAYTLEKAESYQAFMADNFDLKTDIVANEDDLIYSYHLVVAK